MAFRTGVGLQEGPINNYEMVFFIVIISIVVEIKGRTRKFTNGRKALSKGAK